MKCMTYLAGTSRFSHSSISSTINTRHPHTINNDISWNSKIAFYTNYDFFGGSMHLEENVF